MSTRLAVDHLSVELPTRAGWVRPVNDVSFALDEGEAIGIVGESGSGKTMLALALMGLMPHGARRTGHAFLQRQPRNGNGLRLANSAGPLARGLAAPGPGSAGEAAADLITAGPEQIRTLRGGEISMIFQEPMTALNPMMRIGEQIAEAIRVHEPPQSSAEVHRQVISALDRASVPEPEHRARQYPHQLSGGLRQRVMIAMALAPGPGVLIADEPTTALDVTVQKQILDLLAKLRRELRLSLLFISHDLGVVSQIADRVAVMYAGRIIEEGPVNEVLHHPQHPYTEGLLRAAPRLKREKPAPIPGSVPSLDALPPGCAFAPRCPLRIPECDTAMPKLISVKLDGDGKAGAEHRARCILVKRE